MVLASPLVSIGSVAPTTILTFILSSSIFDTTTLTFIAPSLSAALSLIAPAFTFFALVAR